jgi:hypothetical protein
MTIQQILEMANRRIAYLQQNRIAAERIGDIDTVTRIDNEITQTEETITKLQSLLD